MGSCHHSPQNDFCCCVVVGIVAVDDDGVVAVLAGQRAAAVAGQRAAAETSVSDHLVRRVLDNPPGIASRTYGQLN